MIAHGSSSRVAIRNAILHGAHGARNEVVQRLTDQLGRGARAAAEAPARLIESRRFSRPRSRAPTVQARRPMATQEEVFEQVKGILSQQLGVDEDEVTIESSFQADLDADSLDLVELIMELEDQFGVKISDEEAQKIGTVGQAVDFVLAHQS